MSNRETGVVKWFSQAKGYGFIVRADGTEVFVHYRAINWPGFRTLHEGQKVSFELKADPRSNRLQADRIASAEPVYAGLLPDGKARQRRDAVYARSPDGTRAVDVLVRCRDIPTAPSTQPIGESGMPKIDR